MEKFNFDTLTQLVDRSIQLKDGSNNCVELKVDKVSLPKIPDPDYDAFSVDLVSDTAVHCPSGSYVFCHDSFGEVQLFMSPYAAEKYQIVIARKK
ncbi:DUF6916 family protein [Shewanella morhuae]|uniref:DUF6916 domain-containing protein n=1 Tax=Shewanella morhuae TaxID=365591 RepID=A0A380ATR4_9GAMM|nr:hypothetical protein [Shewanella morhuae]SUI87423.1 Uncharacterised protein [Shewanella morhuae]